MSIGIRKSRTWLPKSKNLPSWNLSAYIMSMAMWVLCLERYLQVSPVGDSEYVLQEHIRHHWGRGGLLVDEAGDGLICLGVLVACQLRAVLDRGQEKVSDSLEWGYRQRLTAM